MLSCLLSQAGRLKIRPSVLYIVIAIRYRNKSAFGYWALQATQPYSSLIDQEYWILIILILSRFQVRRSNKALAWRSGRQVSLTREQGMDSG